MWKEQQRTRKHVRFLTWLHVFIEKEPCNGVQHTCSSVFDFTDMKCLYSLILFYNLIFNYVGQTAQTCIWQFNTRFVSTVQRSAFRNMFVVQVFYPFRTPHKSNVKQLNIFYDSSGHFMSHSRSYLSSKLEAAESTLLLQLIWDGVTGATAWAEILRHP